MSPKYLAAVFSGCLAIFLVATLPLSVALPRAQLEQRGIGYSRAEGTIWHGRIEGLRWRGYRVGDATIAVKPLMILAGRLALDADVGGAGLMRGGGRVQITPFGTLILADVSLTADVARLPVIVPLSGHVTVVVAHAEISRRGCRSAVGAIRTDALVRQPAGLPWA
ncbi:MAG: type II secretion system protein N, partial [Rhodospirillaceae bacterium]